MPFHLIGICDLMESLNCIPNASFKNQINKIKILKLKYTIDTYLRISQHVSSMSLCLEDKDTTNAKLSQSHMYVLSNVSNLRFLNLIIEEKCLNEDSLEGKSRAIIRSNSSSSSAYLTYYS